MEANHGSYYSESAIVIVVDHESKLLGCVFFLEWLISSTDSETIKSSTTWVKDHLQVHLFDIEGVMNDGLQLIKC